jgi:hypothetical protein
MPEGYDEMKKLLTAAALLLATALPARASTIGSATWDNTTLMIELLGYSGNLYNFEMSVIFGTGGLQETDQDGHFDYLVGVNFKPNEGNVTGISGTPTTTAAGDWDFSVDANLSSASSSCAIKGAGNDFFCGITTDTLANSTDLAGTLKWNFTLNITGVTDPNNLIVTGTPIRALFADANGQTSLFSLTVPEPTTISLLGIGIAAVALRRRYSRA